MVVRLYDGPLMAVSHARAAQLQLHGSARAIEKAVILREACADGGLAEIEESMKQFASDMSIVPGADGGRPSEDEVNKVASSLVADWLKFGLSLSEAAGVGLRSLPMPQVVVAKARPLARRSMWWSRTRAPMA